MKHSFFDKAQIKYQIRTSWWLEIYSFINTANNKEWTLDHSWNNFRYSITKSYDF